MNLRPALLHVKVAPQHVGSGAHREVATALLLQGTRSQFAGHIGIAGHAGREVAHGARCRHDADIAAAQGGHARTKIIRARPPGRVQRPVARHLKHLLALAVQTAAPLAEQPVVHLLQHRCAYDVALRRDADTTTLLAEGGCTRRCRAIQRVAVVHRCLEIDRQRTGAARRVECRAKHPVQRGVFRVHQGERAQLEVAPRRHIDATGAGTHQRHRCVVCIGCAGKAQRHIAPAGRCPRGQRIGRQQVTAAHQAQAPGLGAAVQRPVGQGSRTVTLDEAIADGAGHQQVATGAQAQAAGLACKAPAVQVPATVLAHKGVFVHRHGQVARRAHLDTRRQLQVAAAQACRHAALRAHEAIGIAEHQAAHGGIQIAGAVGVF